MQCEILLINEERPGFAARRGDIAAIKPAGHRWGRLEKPPRFTVISMDLEDHHIQDLMNGLWRYDFDRQCFVSTVDSQLIWDKNQVNPDAARFDPYFGVDLYQLSPTEMAERTQLPRILDKVEHLLRTEDQTIRKQIRKGTPGALKAFLQLKPAINTQIRRHLSNDEYSLLVKYFLK